VSIAATTQGDETLPTDGLFTITQTAESSTDTVVTLAPTGAALNSTDYAALAATATITAGTTSTTVTIDVTDDAIVEATEDVILTIAKQSGDTQVTLGTDNATLNIADDDALTVEFNQATGSDTETSGGNLPTFLVTGEVGAGHTVSVGVTIGAGTATGGGTDYDDPTALTVNPGTYAAQGIAIPTLAIKGDSIVEPNETIILGIDASPADVTAGGTGSTTYTITNDDTATLSIDNVTLAEGNGGGTTNFDFTVTLDNAVQDGFTVAYSTAHVTTAAGDFSAAISGTATFTGNAGETQTVTIPVLADAIVEADETFTVTLGTVTPVSADAGRCG